MIYEWLDWSGISLCTAIVSLTVVYLYSLSSHRKTKKFDLALSKFYPALEAFISSANRFKDNVNTFNINYLTPLNPKVLDEFFTYPKLQLKNNCTILSLFFDNEDRLPFLDIVNVTDEFTLALSNIESTDTELQSWNKFDKARRSFNKDFNDALDEVSKLLYKKLFKRWQE